MSYQRKDQQGRPTNHSDLQNQLEQDLRAAVIIFDLDGPRLSMSVIHPHLANTGVMILVVIPKQGSAVISLTKPFFHKGSASLFFTKDLGQFTYESAHRKSIYRAFHVLVFSSYRIVICIPDPYILSLV